MEACVIFPGQELIRKGVHIPGEQAECAGKNNQREEGQLNRVFTTGKPAVLFVSFRKPGCIRSDPRFPALGIMQALL